MEPKPPPEPLPPPQPLPIITEETKTRLLEELNLDIDPKTQEILQGISGNRKPSLLSLLEVREMLTLSVFSDLMTSKKEVVRVLNDEIKKIDDDTFVNESRISGMALVLRAFHINSGFDLISRFKNLDDEDLSAIVITLQESLPKQEARLSMTILDRLLSLPQIPEQQIALNQVIVQTKNVITPLFFREGAAAMYQVLGRLWPKLYPPNQNMPQPTPSA